MFKNYIKVMLRSMRKSPVTTSINIVGLALGMATAVIIGLWIWNELSFNKQFKNYKHISQVMLTGTFSGEMSTDAVVSIPVAKKLTSDYGAYFNRVALSSKPENHIFLIGDTKLSGDGIFAEQALIDMLNMQPLKGTLRSIDKPSSIAICNSFAKSLFGNNDPVGKTIKIDNKDNLEVIGVYIDFPANSSFAGTKYIASWNYYIPPSDPQNEQWNQCRFNVFVQLQNGYSNDEISQKILGIMGDNLKDIQPKVLLHPMKKWHLYSTFTNGVNTGGQIQYVWMFGLIGLFVLLLACINFMNLSTAKSSKRAKEIGILKTIGSEKGQLVIKILGESLMVTLLSFVISLALVYVALPWFNSIITSGIIRIPYQNIFFWIICIAFVLCTGIVAGCYPAFYLASFKPVQVLKGGFKAGKTAALSRKLLVVIQFFSSVFLITATIIVLKQLHYAKNRPVGYAADKLINIDIKTPELQQHFEAFKTDLLQSGSVDNVALSSSPVNQLKLSTGGYSWQDMPPGEGAIFGTVAVSADFAQTVKWKFINGRNFSANLSTDSAGVIINKKALQYMGMHDAIGKQIDYRGGTYKIIGVIDDVIMGSPFTSVIPTAFFLGQQPMNNITIKLSSKTDTKSALNKVQSIFSKYNSSAPFEYNFIDESYAKQFQSVETTATLAAFFAVLAIVISALGLYAMASFMAEQRIKEIGIRKVLGARVAGIWKLLTSEFVLLNGIAFLLAIPISWWSMNEWLSGYDYKISISWRIYALTALVTVAITLATVSYQAIKAATVNPVKSLRTE